MKRILKTISFIFAASIIFLSFMVSSTKAEEIMDKCDFNTDWKVDILDMAKIASNYNSKANTGGWNAAYDLNNDNIVDIYDLVIISQNFSQDIRPGNSSSNLANGGIYCEKGGWIYYNNWFGNGELCKVKTDGTGRTKISDRSAYYISVVKGWLYYINPNVLTINRIKIDGSNDTLISTDSSTDMTVYGDDIFYRNDNQAIMYTMKVDGSGKRVVTNDCPGNITVSGQWIYYINYSDNNTPYKIQTDGNGRTKLSNVSVDSLHLYEGQLYYISSTDKSIYKISVTGTGNSRICSDSVEGINVCDGWIYYTNINENFSLYRIDINGQGKQKISDDNCYAVHSCGNNIIYENDNDNLTYYITKDKLEKDFFGFEVYVDDINDNVIMGENYVLPSEVQGKFWLGGAPANVPVIWNTSSVNTSTPGTYRFKGLVYGCNRIINLSVTVETPQDANDRINNISNGGYVTTKDGWTYYSNFGEAVDKGLYKVNADRTKRVKLFDGNAEYINVVGDWVYFSAKDNGNHMCRMKTDGTNFSWLGDDQAYNVTVIGDYIYYTDFNYGAIRRINLDGTGETNIGTDYARGMIIYDGWIYYGQANASNNYIGIIKMRMDGSNRTVLSTDGGNVIGLDDGFLYYSINGSTTSIMKIRLDGSGRTVVTNINPNDFNVHNGWVYYSLPNGLYKMKTDGTGVTQISGDTVNRSIVSGDYIFYNKQEGYYSTKFIRMGTDGSNPVEFGVFIDYINDVSVKVYQGDNYSLPKSVMAVFTDGSQKPAPITWSGTPVDTTKLGVYTFVGTVKDYPSTVNLQVSVVLPPAQGNSTGNIINSGHYAKKGDWIYFSDNANGNKLTKMKYDGSEKTVISSDSAFSLNVDDNFIYYSNASDGCKLYKIDINGNGRVLLSEDTCTNVIQIGDWIYYIGSSKVLYKISTTGTNKMKLAEAGYLSMFSIVNSDWIVYTDPNGWGGIYKVKTDGTSNTQLLSYGSDWIITSGNKIYYNLNGSSGLYSMNTDGTDITQITSYTVSSLNISNNYLYFNGAPSSWNLYKMNLTTGEISVVSAGLYAPNLHVIDDWMYYYNTVSGWYKMKTDGTEKQPFTN